MNKARRSAKKLADRSHRRLSLRGPVTLFIVVLVLIVVLTVLWNVVLVNDYRKLKELASQAAAFHWTYIALGSALFVAIIILSSLLGAQLISQIRWNRRQSNFIASVSHELNSPLSAIKLFAQTLRQKELGFADRLNFVEKILFDVERLQRLIANILRAAELDHRGGELQVVLRRVELLAYLESYIEDARARYQALDLRLSLSGMDDREDCWVDLDPIMFRQVLDNLIDNAIHYRAHQPPEVRVSLRRHGAFFDLELADQGIGIPRSELPRIFNRFYRVEVSAERQGRGTGIGLYVVRSIIEAHGGEVGARSEGAGHGTIIWIRLPVLEEAEQATSSVPVSI